MRITFDNPMKITKIYPTAIQFENGSMISIIRVIGRDLYDSVFKGLKHNTKIHEINATNHDNWFKLKLRTDNNEYLEYNIEIGKESIYNLAFIKRKRYLPKHSEILIIDTTSKEDDII